MQYEVRTNPEFDAWLDGLRDARAATAVAKGLVKLSGGLFGNVKAIGDGLSEMRIDVGAGYRVYFVTRQRTIIVVLSGGDKSTQDQDIATARRIARSL